MRPEGTRKKPESARINAQRIRKCPAGVPLQGRGRGFGAGGRKNAAEVSRVGWAWVSVYGEGREMARTGATIDGVYGGGALGEVKGSGAGEDGYSGRQRGRNIWRS